MAPVFPDECCLRVKIRCTVRHRIRVWHLFVLETVNQFLMVSIRRVRRVGMLYFSESLHTSQFDAAL